MTDLPDIDELTKRANELTRSVDYGLPASAGLSVACDLISRLARAVLAQNQLIANLSRFAETHQKIISATSRLVVEQQNQLDALHKGHAGLTDRLVALENPSSRDNVLTRPLDSLCTCGHTFGNHDLQEACECGCKRFTTMWSTPPDCSKPVQVDTPESLDLGGIEWGWSKRHGWIFHAEGHETYTDPIKTDYHPTIEAAFAEMMHLVRERAQSSSE